MNRRVPWNASNCLIIWGTGSGEHGLHKQSIFSCFWFVLWIEVRFPTGAKGFSLFQTSSGSQPDSCSADTSCQTANTLACRIETSWNVMAHSQKADFVFRRNGRVHLNRRGALVQSTTGSRGVRISGSNAGYTMFRGSVKGTGYPLHSPVSSSLPLLSVTVCHHISTGV